jgi:hypothetical protein
MTIQCWRGATRQPLEALWTDASDIDWWAIYAGQTGQFGKVNRAGELANWHVLVQSVPSSLAILSRLSSSPRRMRLLRRPRSPQYLDRATNKDIHL